MFKSILVPMDLTERHRSALAIALELARAGDGEVRLLHVVELIPGLPVKEEPRFYRRLERSARAHLEKYAASLTKGEVRHQEDVCYGERAAKIAAHAAETGADLIILTAPLVEPSRPATWGSVSYKVGLLARCPVLLVKQAAGKKALQKT